MKWLLFILLIAVFTRYVATQCAGVDYDGIDDSLGSPDSPSFVGTTIVAPAGSLVIAMDNANQNFQQGSASNGQLCTTNSATPPANFNFYAYGAVPRLLRAGIPVEWSIRKGKARDAADFTATAVRVYPSSAPAATISFAGGPFVILQRSAAQANAVLANYQSVERSCIAVYELTADTVIPLRHHINVAPYIGVSFIDNGPIHQRQLEYAGFRQNIDWIPLSHAQVLSFQSNTCHTVFTEPHFDDGSDSLRTTMRNFLQAGGNVIVQCHGIPEYENDANTGNFLTTNGITDENDSTLMTYLQTDVPFMQFVGIVDSNIAGSVQDLKLASGSTFRSTTYPVLESSDTDHHQAIYGRIPNPVTGPLGSFLYYMGGHEYVTNGPTLKNPNALRMFLNAVLSPVYRPPNCLLIIDTDLSVSDIRDSSDPAGLGVQDGLTYEVEVTADPCFATAASSQLMIDLDENCLQYTSYVAPSGVTCSFTAPDRLTCTLGNISPGSSVVVEIITTANNCAGSSTSINAVASSATFDINLGNNQGSETTAIVNINNPPEANDDEYFLNQDSYVIMRVISNDIDNENDIIQLNIPSIIQNPTAGVAIAESEEEIRYTPNNGFHGVDSFRYKIAAASQTDQASVIVYVNANPIAVQGYVTKDIDGPAITFQVTSVVSDPNKNDPNPKLVNDVNPSSLQIISATGGLSVSLSSTPGELIIDGGDGGDHTISYRICDDFNPTINGVQNPAPSPACVQGNIFVTVYYWRLIDPPTNSPRSIPWVMYLPQVIAWEHNIGNHDVTLELWRDGTKVVELISNFPSQNVPFIWRPHNIMPAEYIVIPYVSNAAKSSHNKQWDSSGNVPIRTRGFPE